MSPYENLGELYRELCALGSTVADGARAEAIMDKIDTVKRPETVYCYRLQIWITRGRVDRCGHRPAVADCYPCQHHGDTHAPCSDCH